jgi:hypothetical protein
VEAALGAVLKLVIFVTLPDGRGSVTGLDINGRFRAATVRERNDDHFFSNVFQFQHGTHE